MTTLLSAPDASTPWSAMPGWGIVADLTPPEVIAARGLRTLRKRILAALVLIVLLCAGGYVWAAEQASAADDRLSASQANTTRLIAQKDKYSGVVELQTATQNIDSQISTLMSSDVDLATFIVRLAAATPSGTAVMSANVTLSATDTAPAATAPALTTDATIGTGTLSGTSMRMVDVATYVDALQALPGVVNVIPSTNATTKPGARATWTITFQLTTKLYSHRFTANAAAAGPGIATSGGGHK